MTAQTSRIGRHLTGITLLLVLGLLLGAPPPLPAQPVTITLATDPWPPFYGPELEGGGYLTQLVKTAFQRAGYQCEVRFLPWKRAVEGARAGQYDGLLGAFYSEERAAFFTYSDPVAESHLVFFTKRGRGIQYNGLESFSGLKIGVIRGYQYAEAFDRADYLIREAVTAADQNLEKLIKDRIDLFIESKEVVDWLLRTRFPHYNSIVTAIEPPYTTNKLYIPISRKVANHQRIVADFNLALKMIQADGTQTLIDRHYGF